MGCEEMLSKKAKKRWMEGDLGRMSQAEIHCDASPVSSQTPVGW